MTADKIDIASQYERDGFVFPLDILGAAEAQIILDDLQDAEATLADDDEKLGLLQSYPDRLLPTFDSLIRHPTIIEFVSNILGDNLLVWSASLFSKKPNSPQIVSWHQDLTYWGLDDAEEVTVWVALSPATEASGCMRFVPGSHKERQVPHSDTFAENNLLSRGQEIAVDVNEDDGVSVVLQPGQASMHHGHLFHSSGPNTTSVRRVGSAIRYIKTSMRQQSGDRALVAHVSGEDKFDHFRVAEPPRGRLCDADFELCRHDSKIKRRVLYEGAEGHAGKRY